MIIKKHNFSYIIILFLLTKYFQHHDKGKKGIHNRYSIYFSEKKNIILIIVRCIQRQGKLHALSVLNKQTKKHLIIENIK